MRQPPAHVSRGRLVVAWAVALLAAAWSLALGSPAAAHDVLVGTDPADGSVLDEAPAQVVLTFAAEQAGVGAEVVVTGPDGASWSDGSPVVAGTTVTQALVDGLPDGAYVVAWRSVAQDGHPVTGAFTFTVDVPEADPSPEPSSVPATAAAPEAGDEPDAGGEADAPAEAGQASTAGGWTTWYTAAAVLAVLLALGAAVVVRRSRRG